MKNYSNSNFQRPKDFITQFGSLVMQEFPHALSRSLTKVSPKKQVVIQRVGSSSIGDISKLTLKDIFYKID